MHQIFEISDGRWTDIEAEGLKLDDAQQRQLGENIKKAKRDLRESVWRSHNKVMLLGRDNVMQTVDIGLVTSSASETMRCLLLNHLRQTDEIVKDISPRSLNKNWPPAFTEWSTKTILDTFYASPLFPRLLPLTPSGTLLPGELPKDISLMAANP